MCWKMNCFTSSGPVSCGKKSSRPGSMQRMRSESHARAAVSNTPVPLASPHCAGRGALTVSRLLSWKVLAWHQGLWGFWFRGSCPRSLCQKRRARSRTRTGEHCQAADQCRWRPRAVQGKDCKWISTRTGTQHAFTQGYALLSTYHAINTRASSAKGDYTQHSMLKASPFDKQLGRADIKLGRADIQVRTSMTNLPVRKWFR